MDAQVIARAPNSGGLADHDMGGGGHVIAPAPDDRHTLADEIAATRLRLAAARAELARVNDPELRFICAVQQTLADEQRATDQLVGSIAADADAEVARLRGLPWSPPMPPLPSRRDRALITDDLPWLEGELRRLAVKADTIEGEVRRLADSNPAATAGAGPKFEQMLADAMAAMRNEHHQARERAISDAEHRLAAAREEVERSNDAHVNGAFSPRPASPVGARPVAAFAPLPASTQLVPAPSAPPSAVSDRDRQVQHRDPEPRAVRAKPMILDVVLPLIAVAIVLLVVLSWIG